MDDFVTLSPGEDAMLAKAGFTKHDFKYLNRPPQYVDRDERFLKAWLSSRMCENKPEIGAEYFLHPGGELVVLADNNGPKKIKVTKGVYDRATLVAAVKSGKKPAKASIPEEGLPFISLTQFPASGEQSRTLVGLLPSTHGKLVLIQKATTAKVMESPTSIGPKIGGFLWKLHPSGKISLQRPLISAEFIENYPWCGANTWKGYYYTAVFAQEIADRFDHIPEVLADFQARLKLFPTAKLHSVIPVWIRTHGWGLQGNSRDNISKEEAGEIYGIHMPYMSNVMLRDEFAWRLHLQLGEKMLPGHAYFTDDAKLVISDWCYRETPDGKGTTEMFHGKKNQLDLLAWVAGPCADRFLGNAGYETNPEGHGNEYARKCKKDFQFVRIEKPQVENMKLAQQDLLLKLLGMAVTVNSLEELHAAQGEDDSGVLISLSQNSVAYHVKSHFGMYIPKGTRRPDGGVAKGDYVSAQWAGYIYIGGARKGYTEKGDMGEATWELPGLWLGKEVANLIFN